MFIHLKNNFLFHHLFPLLNENLTSTILQTFPYTAGINYTLKQTSLRTQIPQQQIRAGTGTNLKKTKYRKLFMPQKPWQKN